jgi:hypothetical protein
MAGIGNELSEQTIVAISRKSLSPLVDTTCRQSGFQGFLEADIAADDNITPDDSTCFHVVVDGVGDNTGSHGELHWGGVDDTYDVARSRSLKDSEELTVAAILGVKLDYLLVVVRSLKKLNPGVERAAISREENLDTVNAWVEWECAEGSALNNRRFGYCLGRWPVDLVMDNVGSDGELKLANVANGDCVRTAGCLDHSRERTHLAILRVHTHLERGVIRSMPEFDVGIKRAALGAEDDLELINIRRAVTPSSQ